MERNFVLSIIVGSSVQLLATAATAQIAAFRESTLHPTTIAVEVKPLPLALSVLPGMSSVGAGAELGTDSSMTTFVNGYLVNGNLASGLRNENRNDDVPVIQKIEGYAGDVGGRVYANTPRIDSWYGGAKVGYTMAKSQWSYKEENINHIVRTVTPGLEGGYRWIWYNNMLLRLGVGADGNIVQENNSGPVDQPTDVTRDTQDKVEAYARVAVLPRVDLGLGYRF